MTRIVSYVLCAAVFFGLCGVSLADETETAQSTITSINEAEKNLGIKVNGEPVTIHADDKTSITKEDKNISFSDLTVRNKVKITYVKESGAFGLGDKYVARQITVEKLKTEGAAEVVFVEPKTNSVCVKLNNRTLLLGITDETEFKGVADVSGFKKGDAVFVDYKLDEQGKKIITVMEKQSS